jgi:hypothetical protein
LSENISSEIQNFINSTPVAELGGILVHGRLADPEPGEVDAGEEEDRDADGDRLA